MTRHAPFAKYDNGMGHLFQSRVGLLILLFSLRGSIVQSIEEDYAIESPFFDQSAQDHPAMRGHLAAPGAQATDPDSVTADHDVLMKNEHYRFAYLRATLPAATKLRYKASAVCVGCELEREAKGEQLKRKRAARIYERQKREASYFFSRNAERKASNGLPTDHRAGEDAWRKRRAIDRAAVQRSKLQSNES